MNKNIHEKLIDIEGNEYDTIQIGSQIWMAENLRATKKTDGSDLILIEDNTKWQNTDLGAYCFFDNIPTNKNNGLIYNWYTISDSINPKGWHIPNHDDWITLIKFLTENSYTYDGTNEYRAGNLIAKSLASKTGWATSDKIGSIGNILDNNNSSKFNAKPFGFRFGNGKFSNCPENSILYWADASNNGMGKSGEGIYSEAPSLGFDDYGMRFNSYSKNYGCYIRCIKD